MNDPLAALNERYRSSLPQKRSAILSAFAAWRADTRELEPLRELGRLLHKLAGSAGGYGFIRLGDSARAADGLILDWLSDAPDDTVERSTFVLALEPLMHAVDDLFEVAIMLEKKEHLRGTAEAPPALKVVLVDDDSELSSLIVAQMQREGIEVKAASDGVGMHELLNRSRPDLLVLDFWLRDETGDDLARAAHQLPGLAALPAVCLTSDRTPETRRRALGAGALEVIDKGTPPRQLAGLLRMFAGRAA